MLASHGSSREPAVPSSRRSILSNGSLADVLTDAGCNAFRSWDAEKPSSSDRAPEVSVLFTDINMQDHGRTWCSRNHVVRTMALSNHIRKASHPDASFQIAEFSGEALSVRLIRAVC